MSRHRRPAPVGGWARLERWALIITAVATLITALKPDTPPPVDCVAYVDSLVALISHPGPTISPAVLTQAYGDRVRGHCAPPESVVPQAPP